MNLVAPGQSEPPGRLVLAGGLILEVLLVLVARGLISCIWVVLLVVGGLTSGGVRVVSVAGSLVAGGLTSEGVLVVLVVAGGMVCLGLEHR